MDGHGGAPHCRDSVQMHAPIPTQAGADGSGAVVGADGFTHRVFVIELDPFHSVPCKRAVGSAARSRRRGGRRSPVNGGGGGGGGRESPSAASSTGSGCGFSTMMPDLPALPSLTGSGRLMAFGPGPGAGAGAGAGAVDAPQPLMTLRLLVATQLTIDAKLQERLGHTTAICADSLSTIRTPFVSQSASATAGGLGNVGGDELPFVPEGDESRAGDGGGGGGCGCWDAVCRLVRSCCGVCRERGAPLASATARRGEDLESKFLPAGPDAVHG